MDFDPDSKPRAKRDVVIEDLRHRRDVDDVDEPAPEPEPEHKHEVLPVSPIGDKQPPVYEEPEEIPIVATEAEGALENTPAEAQGDSLESERAYSEDEIRALEREQLRQIISLGLVDYLKYQLTMVLNFALLSLGSAPDPATGLVSKNLPQAKLAIDVLEFLTARLQGEMSVVERQQMAQLVSDLKYSFMQAASEGAVPPGGVPTGDTQGEA